MGTSSLLLLILFAHAAADGDHMNNGNGHHGNVCFHGSSTLQLEDGSQKKLEQIQVGDRVLTADFREEQSFKPVVFMPHEINTKEAVFITINTKSRQVHATSMHLFQNCKRSLVKASDIIPNDTCLRTVNGNETVVSVLASTKQGLYTVVTENEFIVVNGFIASPFAYSHAIPNAFYRAALAALPPSHIEPVLRWATGSAGSFADYFTKLVDSFSDSAGIRELMFLQ
jgi:hypothetical protein